MLEQVVGNMTSNHLVDEVADVRDEDGVVVENKVDATVNIADANEDGGSDRNEGDASDDGQHSEVGESKELERRNSDIMNGNGSWSGENTNGGKRRFPPQATGYELREEIGSGTSGKVYRAWCPEMDEEVAIKVLDLELLTIPLDEIRKEIQIMSLSNHENVVPYSTSFVQGNDLWVVMPLLTGGSVLSLMTCALPNGLEEELAKYILFSMAKALDYFHTNNQMHRDVRAANVMLNAHGKVMLSDYGMMGWMVEGGWERKQRQTFIGTPCWMAPEVMEQTSGYDYKADIWSLGITAIEIAQGKAPYSGFPPMKVMLLTIKKPPPQIDPAVAEKFSDDYKDFVDQCLQKDPKDRPTAKTLMSHKLFENVSMPLYLPDMLADLPPLGSRGSSQKNLYREMRKARCPPRSGIWERAKRGLGWDFEDGEAEAWKTPDDGEEIENGALVGVDEERDEESMVDDSKRVEEEVSVVEDDATGVSNTQDSKDLNTQDAAGMQVLPAAPLEEDDVKVESDADTNAVNRQDILPKTPSSGSNTVSPQEEEKETLAESGHNSKVDGTDTSPSDELPTMDRVPAGALPPPMSFGENVDDATPLNKSLSNLSKGRFIVSDIEFGREMASAKIDDFVDGDDDDKFEEEKSTPGSKGEETVLPSSISIGSIHSVSRSEGTPGSSGGDIQSAAGPSVAPRSSGDETASIENHRSKSRRRFDVKNIGDHSGSLQSDGTKTPSTSARESLTNPLVLRSVAAAAAVAEHQSHVKLNPNPPKTPKSPFRRASVSIDENIFAARQSGGGSSANGVNSNANLSSESLPPSFSVSGEIPPQPPPRLPPSAAQVQMAKHKTRFEVQESQGRDGFPSKEHSFGARSASGRSHTERSRTPSHSLENHQMDTNWTRPQLSYSQDPNTEFSPVDTLGSNPTFGTLNSMTNNRRRQSMGVQAMKVLSNLQQVVTSLVVRNEELEGTNGDLLAENERLRGELQSLKRQSGTSHR
eukprot:Plantae.Rhodophyta-Hildenbrandia_rubra.ctg3614.p1 GENE.Plantae.Rhodophyta-Hildenbrandia_rubra.ctg3614~~Plantae.Rhodophyta-Hildenbrandia_rubra.ctg3614.p1  ORF type:complete len:984 (+),score=210.52 Plantae.Rhodophyta-Hildenbrandia_rubra.ctg3614:1183-4134(+)